MNKDPLLKYALAFIAGIILAEQGNFGDASILLALSVYSVLGIIFYISPLRKYFIFWSILFFLFPGLLSVRMSDDLRNKLHFEHLEGDQFILRLTERPLEKRKSYRAFAKVISRGDSNLASSTGKILVYFQKSENLMNLRVGDYLKVSAKARKLSPAPNPAMFDFRSYLEKKEIYSSIYVRTDELELIDGARKFGMNELSDFLQSKAIERVVYDDLPHSDILKALLFGNRDDLSPGSIKAFSRSGSMHILAVSGLHLGIVYLILWTILRLLSPWLKNAGIRSTIIILGIWVFAITSGMRPPVMRAALMLSLIQVGNILGRPARSLNLLSFAAIILLMIEPRNLWDIGFQLSFAALGSILLFYRDIYDLFQLENPLLKTVWSASSLALSAQIGTLAISVYHFHQFPLLFFVSNLVVLPLAYLIFILAIPAGLFGGLAYANLFQKAMDTLAGWMLNMAERIESLPFSRLEGISINFWECMLLITFLFSISYYLFKRKRPGLPIAIFAILAFSVSNFLEDYRFAKQKTLGILVYDGKSLPIKLNGRSAELFLPSEELDEQSFLYEIEPWLQSRDIRQKSFYFASPPYTIGFGKSDSLLVCAASYLDSKPIIEHSGPVLIVGSPAALSIDTSFMPSKLIFSSEWKTWHLKNVQNLNRFDTAQLYLQYQEGAYIKE